MARTELGPFQAAAVTNRVYSFTYTNLPTRFRMYYAPTLSTNISQWELYLTKSGTNRLENVTLEFSGTNDHKFIMIIPQP